MSILEQILANSDEIDTLALSGLSQTEIGKRFGFDRQWIHFYLKKTELHQDWARNRKLVLAKEKEQKELEIQQKTLRKQLLSEILLLINQDMVRLASEDSFVCQKTIQYLTLYPKTRYPIEKLTSLLQRYENAVLQNKKVPIRELGDGLFKYEIYVSVILKRLSLPTLCSPQSRKVVSEEKIEALRRSLKLDLSFKDLDYFLEISEKTASKELRSLGFDQRSLRKCSNILIINEGRILSNSYRKLSGIYEFADRGSSLDEIAELVGYNKSHVELALRDRSSLEPRVINRLRILYNKEDLNKPYKISIS